MKITCVLLLTSLLIGCFADEKSDLEMKVRGYGLPHINFHTLLCIIEEGRNFKKENHFGIFLIGQAWCSSSQHEGPNYCNIPCEKLLDKDYNDDLCCVNKILKKEGIYAWKGIAPKCFK